MEGREQREENRREMGKEERNPLGLGRGDRETEADRERETERPPGVGSRQGEKEKQ